MTKDEAREQAIERVKGEYITPGAAVGSKFDPRVWEYIESCGDVAVCRIGEELREFPRAEIFDVRRVINVANHLLNVGFWKEGMEGFFVSAPSGSGPSAPSVVPPGSER